MSSNYMYCIRFTMLILLSAICLFAQEPGEWCITVNTNYSQPIGSLNDWFKSTYNFGLGIGHTISEDWFVEGIVEYTNFDDENISGYAKDNVDLKLEHVGILANGKYQLAQWSKLEPFFNIGGGLFYWKGSRGQIEANPDLDPSLPFIERKILEEWNWGFRTGVGLEYKITQDLSSELMGYYRIVVGDLWPTLQPHIELEGVSGFQTLNLAFNIRYYF